MDGGAAITAFSSMPWERGGVIAPGLPVLPPGVERHPVLGGGSRTVAVRKGDSIAIVDREGLQPGEIVFFDKCGWSDAGMLGAKGTGRPPKVVMAALEKGGSSGRRVLAMFAQAGINLAAGDAVSVFAQGSKPGDMVVFDASCDGLLTLASFPHCMQPGAQDATTELVLYVRRSDLHAGKKGTTSAIPIPDPLADPLRDLCILPGAALVYEVKAGEFIQILDVQGRECSDFQAFSLRDLDRGVEREIDPTTTRSLMGTLYPRPGIYSKYWTVDQQPLVEIVQDTCGRHDTFGLACTARYYEDLGYPGHVNCSDNINAGLARYDVRARAGWPAVNFFFNTGLDDANGITMDDPWSRPGDYVLLRALTDLLCVSTACPCDIDPANGWNPTEIQLRTYAADEDFHPGIGFRKSTEDNVQNTRNTAFHACFARHSRDFVEYNGYWLPNSFPAIGTLGEYWAAREKAALMDLSPLRKFEVTGPDAEALMQYCVTRNMRKLATGGVCYTAMCHEHGGMIDDGTVFRLGEMNFRWVGGVDAGGHWLKQQAKVAGLNVWVRNSTDQLHNLAIQGRLSRQILEQVLWTPPTQPALHELLRFHFTIGRLDDLHGAAVVVSRTGFTGELGFEIFCAPADAEQVFNRIWEAGEPLGLAPLGLAALDLLRVEAGLAFAGREFDDQTDPFEAGIGFTVPLNSKPDDFCGRESLLERAAHPQRKLVGLEVAGGTVPSSGDCLRVGRAQVGVITSAIRSPALGRVIALARVATRYAAPGMVIEVGQLDGQQKRLKARVVPMPHFDPARERVKGVYEQQPADDA